MIRCLPYLILCVACIRTNAADLAFFSEPGALFQFGHFAGGRIRANTENWLLTAPAANPGLLEMFQLRDREPAPKLVPWAGEFAGKYLISAIQALRMDSDPRLESLVREVLRRLIASQDSDGYLGPFRKEERLRGHWDLWAHYHCMLALLMWHERTGDQAALDCARRAANLVCGIYLDTGRRAIDAGSDEMNLAIIHALGWLHRITPDDRYFRMMREIEKDWERAGDYLRTGLDGVEFFQSPRPRWESLHDLQGLVELHRITGDEKYRRAFEHHWRSIARWDLRNTGGFSSGEQATGNPYAPSAIETCCGIAWMAVSIDMLRLTGDARVADLLELAVFNAWAGAQHPSGRWCTYNTPMDGVREASAHSIVFQARHGTPELNCCSVNGPRGWGMLSEWAVMRAADGWVINWLAPVRVMFSSNATIQIEGTYPVDPEVVIRPHFAPPHAETALRIRIPEWSRSTAAFLNDVPLPSPKPGAYLTLRREWREGDHVRLKLDLGLRTVTGNKEAAGKISIYRGPILLAWDQRFNARDEAAIPRIDPPGISAARILPAAVPVDSLQRVLAPLLRVELPAGGNETIQLCDFASAGAAGTRYRSWLNAKDFAPPPAVTRFPRDGAAIGRGQIAFRWSGGRDVGEHELQISPSEDFTNALVRIGGLTHREVLVQIDERFSGGRWYYWQVVSRNAAGETPGVHPAARFRVDPSLPRALETLDPARPLGPNGEIVRASLSKSPAPEFGEWRRSDGWRKGEGIVLNGLNERLIYEVGDWPEENYSVSLRFRLKAFPTNRLGQIFSAWAAPGDDPLRLTIDKDRLFARIEATGAHGTEGVPIELNRWHQLTAVKNEDRLNLYLDGALRGSCSVPRFISTRARDFALGGNPHYGGNEFLAVELAELFFYPRALPAAAPR